MSQVYISAGSNSNRQQNIALALARLKKEFGELVLSPVYESKPVDGRGDNYYNLALGFQTELPLAQVQSILRGIENDLGRERSDSATVSIDLDLLLYGGCNGHFDGVQLPHPDLSRYRHALQPLADIAGDVVLPGTQQTLQSLLNDPGMADFALERVSGH